MPDAHDPYGYIREGRAPGEFNPFQAIDDLEATAKSRKPAVPTWREALRIDADGNPSSKRLTIEGNESGSARANDPPVRQLVTKLDDVQAWTKANKVKMNVYWDNSISEAEKIRIANLMINAFDYMKAKGVDPPNSVAIKADAFNSRPSRGAVAYAYNHTLFLNPKSLYWDDPQAFVSKRFQDGTWSTDHVFHPFFHEAGHYSHYARDQAGYEALWDRKYRIKSNIHDDVVRHVSRYALDQTEQHAHEFMAEVHAKLMASQTVPDRLLKEYVARGGRIPK